MNGHELNHELPAYADGELDPAQTAAWDRAVQGDANLADQVRYQRQLRESVSRVMVGSTPLPSASLRDSITKIVLAPASVAVQASVPRTEPAEPVEPAVVGRIGFPTRWVLRSGAIAAVLGFSALVVWSVSTEVNELSSPVAFGPQVINPSIRNDSMTSVAIGHLDMDLPAEQVTRFTGKHKRCSELIERMRAFENSPEDLTALPAYIGDYVGSAVYPSLDLSRIGYQFLRAGPCGIPCRNSSHLIFASAPDASGAKRHVSLWIAPDEGRLPLEPGRLYRARQTDETPVVAWRHGELVYFLVGESLPEVNQVYASLATR